MTTDPRKAKMIGQVAGIWRYPVKSMRGEHVTAAAVDDRGLVGDRLFAVRDAEGKFGSGKNTRRFRRMDGLLDFKASCVREPGPRFLAELTCPDGSRHQIGGPEADDAVRAHLGRDDVALRPSRASATSTMVRSTCCPRHRCTGRPRLCPMSQSTNGDCRDLSTP